MRKGCMLIFNKIWSRYSQWRRFSESKPVPCTNSFREKRLSMLASYTANLSKFHVVFSSSTLIRLDNDAFEWHLCQAVNNFVKQNKSSLLSPLRKRHPPQHIKHIRNTRVSLIPTFDEPCSSTLHPLNFVTVVLLVWVPNSGAILHKRANQRKVSSLLKLLWAALQVATQKQKLGVSLVCHGRNVFWPLQVVTESYPQVLSVHDVLQYLSCQWVVESLGSRVRDTRIKLHLAALKRIPHVLPQFSNKWS